MKIKKLAIIALTCGLSSIVCAAPLFQAGNITEGKKWSINSRTGLASYYADGKSGKVEFQCDLQGKPEADGRQVKALLRTGKNFENIYNPPLIPLEQGMNGPFIWTLTDEKTDAGNIKVFYTSGSEVTIQCVGKKLEPLS